MLSAGDLFPKKKEKVGISMKQLLRVFRASGLFSSLLFISSVMFKSHAMLSHLLYVSAVVSVFLTVGCSRKLRHLPSVYHCVSILITLALIITFCVLMLLDFHGARSELMIFSILSVVFAVGSIIDLRDRRAESRLTPAIVKTVFDPEELRQQMRKDGLL